MQETRRLMDNNSASFQMFIILLSFMIAVGSESQMSVDHVTLYSSNGILRYLMGGGGGGACVEAKVSRFFSEKKTAYSISLDSISSVFS